MTRHEKLSALAKKTYFTPKELQELLEIKAVSANVLASRYAKDGIFIRLKKNFYALHDSWDNFGREEMFRISNLLQVPSYVSFMTALSFYELTTQVQRDYYESATFKRSVKTNVKGKLFVFQKLKKKYYFDFVRKDTFFIATPEKAFVDCVYLRSFGKYKFDLASIDTRKLNKTRLKRILKAYPAKTRSMAANVCTIS
jgi:predicted transcriptional regulator of viral defense system